MMTQYNRKWYLLSRYWYIKAVLSALTVASEAMTTMVPVMIAARQPSSVRTPSMLPSCVRLYLIRSLADLTNIKRCILRPPAYRGLSTPYLSPCPPMTRGSPHVLTVLPWLRAPLESIHARGQKHANPSQAKPVHPTESCRSNAHVWPSVNDGSSNRRPVRSDWLKRRTWRLRQQLSTRGYKRASRPLQWPFAADFYYRSCSHARGVTAITHPAYYSVEAPQATSLALKLPHTVRTILITHNQLIPKTLFKHLR